MVGMILTWPSTEAHAETKTIAVYVDGQDAKRLRPAVLAAVGSGIVVAGDSAFRQALIRAGQKKPLGKNLDPKAIDRIRKAGVAIGADAVVLVRSRADRKSRSVLLIVVDVTEGAGPSIEVGLDLKSGEKDRDEIATALAPLLSPYLPPVEPAETPPPRPPEVAPSPAPEIAHEAPAMNVGVAPAKSVPPPPPAAVRKTTAQLAATSLVDLALGGQAAGREFVYENGITRLPYVYKLFPTLTTTVSGRVFPLATLGGPGGDIGIAADFSLTHLQGKDLRGALNNTVPISYSLELCARIHPWPDARLVLIPSFGYALMSFGSVGPFNAALPDVTYQSLRPALDARVSFGNFSILAVAAFRAILDGEAISTRFYNPRGYGFDGEIGEAVRFLRRLEARLMARYERYSFTFRPSSGATFAPGFATDQLYGARLSLAVMF
jgi:hypothetical protein